VHREGVGWHVTFRAQITVKPLTGRRAVDQLNRSNLDDAVAVQRVEPGCLGIDHDFTRGKVSQKVHQKTLVVI
jgi:hypothetical protein